jgi:DNA-binding response OmpR family regulator
MPKLPLKVIIVEDEALIALLVEDALLAAGYTPCGVASTEIEALRLLEVERPGFAVVDINLGTGGSGLVIGQELGARGVAVLYASGHCLELEAQMSRTGARACLRKPYSPDDMGPALDALALIHAGKLPRRLPEAFHMIDG